MKQTQTLQQRQSRLVLSTAWLRVCVLLKRRCYIYAQAVFTSACRQAATLPLRNALGFPGSSSPNRTHPCSSCLCPLPCVPVPAPLRSFASASFRSRSHLATYHLPASALHTTRRVICSEVTLIINISISGPCELPSVRRGWTGWRSI